MAKNKPIRKVDKQLERELRQPDEFVTWVDRLYHYADNHRPLVVAGFVGLFLLVVAGNGVVALMEHQAERRHAAEFTALQETSDALKRDGDGASSAGKIDDLIAKASGKDHRARLYLTKADLLMEKGQYAKAAEAYEGALAHAGKGLGRDLAAIGLASARMKAGDPVQTAAALQGVDGPLATLAQVEHVRLAVAQKNYGEAQSLVSRLEADAPNSPALATARGLLQNMDAAPAGPAAEIVPAPR